ncbi:TPA_asm: integrase [Physarum slime mold MELD virus]|nr:TPA_asm: integrase [Physarum slime mold MELD virus]
MSADKLKLRDLITSPRFGLWLSRSKYKNNKLLSEKTNTNELTEAIRQSEVAIHGQVPLVTVPIVAHPGDYQCDIAFVGDYAKFNGGNGIIVNLIHVPSRYLYSELIKNKSDTVKYLIKIIPTLNPLMTSLTVDAGTEFVNAKLKEFLKNKNITLTVINKSTDQGFELGVVERVNRTVRDLIERFITTSGRTGVHKFKFDDKYEELITNYNNSPHSSNYASTPNSKSVNTPAQVLDAYQHPNTHENADLIIAQTIPKIKQQELIKKKIKEKFPIGSYVYVLSKTCIAYEKGSIAKFNPTRHKVLGYSSYRVILDINREEVPKLYHELKPAGTTTDNTKVAVSTTKPQLKLIKKIAAINKKEAHESTDKANIITDTRARKAPKRLDL